MFAVSTFLGYGTSCTTEYNGRTLTSSLSGMRAEEKAPASEK